MTQLVTNTNRLHAAEQVLESITEPANTQYYMFVADHTDHPNTELQPVYDNTKTSVDAYHNMIFGKKLEPTDLKLMIRNVPYQSNIVYTMYDDQEELILQSNFYAVVNAVSYYHVYKCLDNNQGIPSTVEPEFSHITGSNTFIYQTSDGYRWKYMYSVDSANVVKFETASYFPIVPNTQVEDTAVAGAIDIIRVDGEGRGYDNYVDGIFSPLDIRYDGDVHAYALANNVASAVNGYYTGCMLYLSSGTGSGQYRLISDYYSNNEGRYMIVNSAFTTTPDGTTEFQVTPSVKIVGDGRQLTNADARALVNALASNSIHRVEMLNRGAGYTYHTANVIANAVVGVLSNTIVRPIYSPYHGHGYDAARELGSHHLSFTLEVANNEGNTLVTSNKFQQIGMLKDPLFANVVVEMESSNGFFINNEKVLKINPVRLENDVSIASACTTVTASGADFANQISSGDWVYFQSGSGLLHQVVQIDSVSNSSEVILAQNAYFSCTTTTMYQANISSNAYVMTTNGTHVFVTNVAGEFLTSDIFIGEASGAKGVVNTTIRNGEEKIFDTYQNMYKYTGTVLNGTFNENEVIYQGNLQTSNALLHSANISGGTLTVYTTNQVGQFVADGANNIIGNESGALAIFTEAYAPELVFGSGEILFLQNIQAITRSANTNETFQIIFEY